MLVHTHLLMNACVHSNVIPVWLTQDKSFCRLLLKHENETLFSVYTSLSSSFFQVELWWLYIFSFCKFSAEFVLTWGRIYFSLFVLNRINNPSHWRASGKACLPLMITTLAGTHTNMGATNARARARRGGDLLLLLPGNRSACLALALSDRRLDRCGWPPLKERGGGRKGRRGDERVEGDKLEPQTCLTRRGLFLLWWRRKRWRLESDIWRRARSSFYFHPLEWVQHKLAEGLVFVFNYQPFGVVYLCLLMSPDLAFNKRPCDIPEGFGGGEEP